MYEYSATMYAFENLHCVRIAKYSLINQSNKQNCTRCSVATAIEITNTQIHKN